MSGNDGDGIAGSLRTGGKTNSSGQDAVHNPHAEIEHRMREECERRIEVEVMDIRQNRDEWEERCIKAEAERDLFKGCCTRAFDEWLKLHPDVNPWPDGAVRLVEIMGKAEVECDRLRGQVVELRHGAEAVIAWGHRPPSARLGQLAQWVVNDLEAALTTGAGAPEAAIIKAAVEFADAERKKLGPSVGSTRAAERWNRALAALLEATEDMPRA